LLPRFTIKTAFLLFVLAVSLQAAPGVLSGVEDSLTSYASNTPALHKFTFTLSTIGSGLPADGKIRLVFPSAAGFDLSSAIAVMSADATLLDGGFLAPVVSGDSVLCTRDGSGTSVGAGSTVSIWLALVGNPPGRVKDTFITVRTLDNADTILDSGTSLPFHIDGPIHSYNFGIGSTSTTKTAGVPFNLFVTNALDMYGNPAVDTVAVSAVVGATPAPDGTAAQLNPIMVRNGAGSAPQILFKQESVKLRGTSGSSVVKDVDISVWHTNASRLVISGEPTTVQSGASFSNDIKVTAYDPYGNLAKTYNRTVLFNVVIPDDNKLLPAAYPFETNPADDGQHTFPGSEFKLTKAGQQRIIVYDNQPTPLRDTTDVITVTASSIASFSLSVNNGSPVTAGVDFPITISNAKDAAGNPMNGTAVITFDDANPHTSPSGLAPQLTAVQVVNGSGVANSRLYLSEAAVVLKATMAAGVFQTATVNVLPGAAADLQVTGAPVMTTTVVAGQKFGVNGLRVRVLDAFGNIKTNYSGNLYFTSSDGQAVLTYTNASPLAITSGDVFVPGTNFELRTSGQQTITARTVSPSLNKTTAPIQVQSAVIAGFTFSVATPQIAGQQFPLSVTNARDAYNNAASGTILINATVGASEAPNKNAAATLTNIPVVNGSGSSPQVLVCAEAVTLRGVVSGNTGVNRTTDIIVNPGALSYFAISGAPPAIAAGANFPGGVTVKAYDAFANLKTNYTGKVYFTSTDANAYLYHNSSNTYTFTTGDAGSHTFPGSYFKLQTAGRQNLIVRDNSTPTLLGQTSIDVSSLTINRIYSSNLKVSRGQTNAVVMMEVANSSDRALTNVQASLQFYSGGTPYTDDYQVTRVDGLTTLPAAGQATLQFQVRVEEDAALTTITVNGFVSGKLDTLTMTDSNGATTTHSWQVQSKAALQVTAVRVSADTLNQGQGGVTVECDIKNNGTAGASLTSSTLQFLKDDITDVSASFSTVPYSNNAAAVAGGQTVTLRYYLASGNQSQLGRIYVYQNVAYSDVNSSQTYSVRGGVDTFINREASVLQITGIIPSQATVTQSQTAAWTVSVSVQNSGSSAVTLSFDGLKTFLRVRKAQTDLTSTYTIVQPSAFTDGTVTLNAGQSKSLRYTITKTGTETGVMTLLARAETTTGVYVSDASGSVEVQPAEVVRVSRIVPSQPAVTVNDNSYEWKIFVLVENSGGSEVAVQFDSTVTDLIQTPAILTLTRPTALARYGANLRPGQSDTLIYTVRRTGAAVASVLTLDAKVGYRVVNTGEFKSVNSGSDVRATVQLQTPSNFVIDRVRVSRKPVTQGSSNWWVTVQVSNQAGGSDVQLNLADSSKTWVKLYDSGGQPVDYYFRLPGGLAGSGGRILAAGKRDSLIFQLKSSGSRIGPMSVAAQVTAVETNRNKSITALASGVLGDNLTIQSKAQILFVAKSLQPAYVSPGDVVRYQISASNAGGSTLVLDPAGTKLEFSDGLNNYSASLDPALGVTLTGQANTVLYFNLNPIAGGFLAGVYFPTVTLKGTENGNPFSSVGLLSNNSTNVGTAKTLTIQSLNSSVPTVTAGQTKPWKISMVLVNNGDNTLRLNNSQLSFFRNDVNISTNFSLTKPALFNNGSLFLRGKSSQTLSFTINEVASTTAAGVVMISGSVSLTDSARVTQTYSDETKQGNSAYVTVQTQAVLEITKMSVSQPAVTRGQKTPWKIGVGVRNNGGSRVEVRPASGSSRIMFSKGDVYFTVQPPKSFLSGAGLQLGAGAEDSLVYTVSEVSAAPAVLGQCRLSAALEALELNSDRIVYGLNSPQVTIVIQDSARVRIDTLVVTLPADSTANAGQRFYFRAKVTNVSNGETVRSAQVRILSRENLSIFPDPSGATATVDTLTAGQSKWTSRGVLVQAANLELGSVVEHFSSRVVQAVSENTGEPVAVLPALQAADTSKTIRIQRPGTLAIERVITTADTISAGSGIPWGIRVLVFNAGQGSVDLATPAAGDILFSLPGFSVQAPVLTKAKQRLAGGERDTLEYQVLTTGPNSGTAAITAVLSARDVNDSAREPLQAMAQQSVQIASTSRARITKTFVVADANRIDEAGIVHVNTRQNFRIGVEVKNEGGQNLKEVAVGLQATESILFNGAERLVKNLGIGEPSVVYFDVRADSMENLSGETFLAVINQAVGIDGSQARILAANDSIAVAQIYTPALLQITATVNQAPSPAKNVSMGQSFPIKVTVKNRGSEPVSNVLVHLEADSLDKVSFAQTTLAIPGTITSQDTGAVVFSATALSRPGPVAFTSSIVQSLGLNSNTIAAVQHEGESNRTSANIEPGAKLQILRVFSSTEEINAGDSNSNWRINVELVNSGQSALHLTDVNRSNITIKTEGKIDPDYVITPVSLIRSGNFQLAGGGVPDTLNYVVTKNGDIAGNAEITVRLQGYDVNLGQPNPSTIQTAQGKDTVSVSSVSWVRIDLAQPKGRVSDDRGNWLVNRGQVFQINVSVETGELGGVDSVQVQLTSNGLSTITPSLMTIARLNRASKDTVRFTVTADAGWNAKLSEKHELFTAKILSAKTLGTPLPAQIRNPRREVDAQVAMRIQNPAQVRLDLQLRADKDSILTAGQAFTVVARMTNLGSAPLDSGRIRLHLPEYFTLTDEAGGERDFYIVNDTQVVEDSFHVTAPNFESLNDIIRCQIIVAPEDLNSREPAPLVANGRDSIRVSTSRSGLFLSNSRIFSPNGALAGEISTLQYIGLQTEIQATPNLSNVKVTLELPSGMGYSPNLETPLQREISSFPALIQWTVRAPDKAVANSHHFYIRAEGRTDLSTKSTLDSIRINRVVTRAQLSMQPLMVSSPLEAIQSPGGVFSAGQSATLSTLVTNSGTARVSQGKIRIDFLESGFILAAGETAEKIFTISNIVTWNVIAPLKPSVETKQIEIRMTAVPVDEHTGQEADIIGFPNSTLSVLTIEAGAISSGVPGITAPAGAKDNLISTDQSFEVTLSITTRRVVQDKITAQLVFSNPEYKIDQETRSVTYGENQKVQWTVTAPSTVSKTRPDSFYVVVRGYDERSPSPTRSLTSPKAIVQLQNKTVFSMRPAITQPDSLNQYVVSTDEDFVLTSRLIAAGAPYETADPFVVQMTKPVEFTTTDTLEQSKVRAHPYWRLRAPSKKPEGLSIFRFRLKKVPRDLNSNQYAAIENIEESYSIQVVRRAEVSVAATLSDTARVSYAPVRIGSVFNIYGFLVNSGEAGFVGAPALSFKLPSGYTLLSKTGGDTVVWRVRAPETISDVPDTFTVKLFAPLPVDQYSRKTVLVKQDSARVIIKREAGMLVIKPNSVKSGATTVKGARDLAMMGFSLRNKDISLNSRSVLDTLRLEFRDKKGNAIKASEVVSRIVAVNAEDHQVLAELSSPPAKSEVLLDFTVLHADTIRDSDEFRVALLVDVLDEPVNEDFQLTIDSASAVIARDALSRYRLLLADSTEKRISVLAYSSGAVVLIDQKLEASFCNYPNPFGTSARPETRFVYYLQQSSDLELKIFTLTGDLVFSWDFKKAEHPAETSAGLHDGDIYWDGRNGLGQRVMSGVYLAYLSVDGGQVAISKIAVIR